MGVIRLAQVLTSLILGLMAALFGAELSRKRLPEPPFPQVTGAALERALDRERPYATSLGMTLVDEREVAVRADPTGRITAWSEEVDIPAGGCVAVVAGARGHVRPRAAAIQPLDASREMVAYTPAPLSAQHNVRGVATQVQWCERSATRRVVVVEYESVDPTLHAANREGVLRRALYRGELARVGGLLSLRRGDLSAEALAAAEAPGDVERRAARHLPQNARALGPSLRIEVGRATLLPADATTFSVLWRAAAGDDDVAVNPRFDAAPAWGAPWPRPDLTGIDAARSRLARGRPLPAEHDPWHEVARNAFRRTLLVLDPSRLGAPCVTVVLTRRRASEAAWAARSPEAPSLEVHEHVVTDHVCGGAPVLYETRDDDGEAWQAQLFAG